MSYCVHCGVELGDCEQECPLCRTPVIDSRREKGRSEIASFPERMDIPQKRINKHFLAYLIAIMLLFPLLAVIITDLIMNAGITWSLYVLGAELCLWSFFVLPFNCPNRPPYLYASVNTVVIAIYTLMIFLVTGRGEWYFGFALPIILLIGISANLIMLIYRKKQIDSIAKCGWCIILLSVFLIALDILICYYITKVLTLSWSWYAAFPLLVLGIVVLIISHSTVLCDWIKRKLFF